MRAAATVVLCAIAASVILAGSCLWAWSSDEFWKPWPLYPAVLISGVLAGIALSLHSGRPLKAAWLGAVFAFATLISTAVITLVRWDL